MSIDALNWAKKRTAGSTGRKATLLLLADRSDDYGVVYAGVNYLATVLECHRDTVINNIAALEKAGLIERIRRTKENGAPTSSLTVLGARLDDRGDLLDPRGHDEHAALIAAALAKPRHEPKSGSSEPKSGNPESGFSWPKSGSTPAQVGIPDPIPSPGTVSLGQSPTDARESAPSDEADRAGQMLDEAGVVVIDGGLLQRYAESHPRVDLVEVARLMVEAHRSPKGLRSPAGYLAKIVTGDSPPLRRKGPKGREVASMPKSRRPSKEQREAWEREGAEWAAANPDADIFGDAITGRGEFAR